MSGAVFDLHDKQRLAVDPRDSVWLSASAGTGKTQVLSARVLRLLIEGQTQPSDILCLTFTKAGAAEMTVRVKEVLARWVRLDDGELGRELNYLGAAADPATRARARSLFASVLDCPGGGLRIDTIHAFAQYLISAFPGEAGVLPGVQALDDRERALLSEEVLTRLVVDARRAGDAATLDALGEMSRRKGPDGVKRWLMRCAVANELWFESGGWQAPMRSRVCALLEIPSGADSSSLVAMCADDRFDIASLEACLAHYGGWKAASGVTAMRAISEWLASDAAGRMATLDELTSALFFKNGNARLPKNADPAFVAASAKLGEQLAAIGKLAILIELADFLSAQLELGRRFALMWDEAKQREGLVDFDDLIRRAAVLLSDANLGPWIRYKLDRRFDHILIDEAQDTNAAQWAIIDALTDDFFSGEGAHGDRLRTIFTVGDTKQAIFGFQGTSPKNFTEAKQRVSMRIARGAQAASAAPGAPDLRPLQDLDLERSFRTAAPILNFVDQAIAGIGPENLGLERAPPAHIGQDRPGLVGLWNLVIDGSGAIEEEGQQDWLARHDRMLADKIARQVASWLDPEGPGFALVKGQAPSKARRAGPGDVMVLVRKRRELASLIVARLYAHGVPVAGIDRLRLGAPLAIQDLMAAIRFAVQPLDDLNLANLLVSPLIGWSQEDLLQYAHRPEKMRLWHHLRDAADETSRAAVAKLRQILSRADFDDPQALLHWVLTGPFDGRRQIVARLGVEANDPIDELLNAAAAFSGSHTASLQGFIRWFDAGEGELKREAGEAGDLVRVMTVHGSKGLQAPIVILADTAIAPDAPGELELVERPIGNEAGRAVPLPSLSKEQRVGPIAQAYEDAAAVELQEHWRLLYVAMTRAEEALFIGGSLGPRDAKRGTAHEDSWYARLASLFEADGIDDPIWGARREWGSLSPLVPTGEAALSGTLTELPDWAARPAPQEPRPPRPLAPSGLGEIEASDPPLPPEIASAAARRGVLIHGLLERLPAVQPDLREALGRRWLARQAPELEESALAEMLESALGVLHDERFASIFALGSLAEIPLAAIVGGQVIAGTADRLLLSDDAVLVVDFKTARRPPGQLEDVPETTVRQMAAYVAALETIYPGRRVSAALLYTQTPQLIALPDEVITPYKNRLSGAEQSFSTGPVA